MIAPACYSFAYPASLSSVSMGVDVANNYFVGVGNELFQSNDSGLSWNRTHNFGATISSIAASPNGTVWVATRGTGVYVSTDHGVSFSGVNGGLGSLDVTLLNVQRGGKLFAATQDKGLFATIGDMPLTRSGVPPPIAATLALACYPNPAHDRARVVFTLPHTSHVKLELFDVLGNRLQSICDGLQPEGQRIESLDTHSLNAGIYFVRLQADNEIRTDKIVLER